MNVKSLNVLVTCSSFKDTFSSVEINENIKKMLDGFELKSQIAPFCDGGEHTFDVMNWHLRCKEVIVENVYDARLKKIRASYLEYENVAYVISSEILRINDGGGVDPSELSDYGLGQLVLDAVNKGFKKIIICLGGISTAAAGFGFAQALGVRFYDSQGTELRNPIKSSDIRRIHSYQHSALIFDDIDFKVISDGIVSAQESSKILHRKIKLEKNESIENSLFIIQEGIKKAALITRSDISGPFTGVAGAMKFGVDLILKAEWIHGGEFFYELFCLSTLVEDSDLIITGEGQLDNSSLGKGVFTIVKAARVNKKRLIFLAGALDRADYNAEIFNDLFTGFRLIVCFDKTQLKEYSFAAFPTNYHLKVETLERIYIKLKNVIQKDFSEIFTF